MTFMTGSLPLYFKVRYTHVLTSGIVDLFIFLTSFPLSLILQFYKAKQKNRLNMEINATEEQCKTSVSFISFILFF